MELRTLDKSILNEIAKRNFHNLTHHFFDASKTEFEQSIDTLKEYGLIQGNIFSSNGSIKEQFRFFFLMEKGESYLSKQLT